MPLTRGLPMDAPSCLDFRCFSFLALRRFQCMNPALGSQLFGWRYFSERFGRLGDLNEARLGFFGA